MYRVGDRIALGRPPGLERIVRKGAIHRHLHSSSVVVTEAFGSEIARPQCAFDSPETSIVYEGSACVLGRTETVKVNLKEVDPGAGKLNFSGYGIEGFICSDKTYINNCIEFTLSFVSDCLPPNAEVTRVLYCSDNDKVQVVVKVSVATLSVTAKLNEVACASAEEFATHTGDTDFVITAPICYRGSAGALGLIEIVTINLKTFESSAGTFDFSDIGTEVVACVGKTMTKFGQEITINDSSECLPSGIVVLDVKYCSDSNTIKLSIKDKAIPLPISPLGRRPLTGARRPSHDGLLTAHKWSQTRYDPKTTSESTLPLASRPSTGARRWSRDGSLTAEKGSQISCEGISPEQSCSEITSEPAYPLADRPSTAARRPSDDSSVLTKSPDEWPEHSPGEWLDEPHEDGNVGSW